MNHLYLYFSGTGNTKFAMETFASIYEENNPFHIHSIEESIDFERLIDEADLITLGYPIYGSMMPDVMVDFIETHKSSFSNKTVMVLITQMMFSGDGAGLAYYLLKDMEVNVEASMHINMPDNISDLKIMPIKVAEKQGEKYRKAEEKIQRYVARIKAGKTVKTGRRFYSRAIGYLFQRIFFKPFHNRMKRMLKINLNSCILCGKCVDHCPTNNLEIANDRVVTKNQCTLCYRCINICPTKSIKMLGKHYPNKQYYKK